MSKHKLKHKSAQPKAVAAIPPEKAYNLQVYRDVILVVADEIWKRPTLQPK